MELVLYISTSNITMEIIEKYPDKPWNWRYTGNPNITIVFIKKYINKIIFRDYLPNYQLSTNTFTLENKRLQMKEAYWMLEKIQAFPRIVELVMINKYI